MKIRNIKFKAKRLDNGEWVKGDFAHSLDGGLNILGFTRENGVDCYSGVHLIDPETICQFTGLKDCRLNEIWEGDIIQNPEFPFDERTVTWSNNSSCFMPIDEDGCKDRDFSFLVLFKKWTVVGNKFDKEK